MTWLLLYEIGYVVIAILFCLRIIYDTRSNTKALGYMLLVIFLPLIGILFYSIFGINYRKRKIFRKKLIEDDEQEKQLRDDIFQYSKQTLMRAASRSKAVKDWHICWRRIEPAH